MLEALVSTLESRHSASHDQAAHNALPIAVMQGSTLEHQPIIDLLIKLGAASVGHSGGSLLLHLLGTYEILTAWGASSHVRLAGLCHSIYGTASFGQSLLDYVKDRSFLRQAIGAHSESLVFEYSTCNWATLRKEIEHEDKPLHPGEERRSAPLKVRAERAVNLLHIALANEAEQLVRTGAEAILSHSLLTVRAHLLPGARQLVERSARHEYPCTCD